MKTSKLGSWRRVHWLILGGLVLGAGLSLTSHAVRQWVRHRIQAASAALLFNPQGKISPTSISVNSPTTTFSVHSYVGKCLESTPPAGRFGITQAFSSTPVFINDCNGSATQQVRVEELTDRLGHLVVLHLGNQVLGTKTAPLTVSLATGGTSGSSSAPAIEPTPLEAQAYTGSEGQIFALDGDSIILAANRNLVVAVQHGRGANKTPLVLGQRNLDDSEFWTFTATDGSGRKPTSGFVHVSQMGELMSAINQASLGTVIEVDQGASINLNDQLTLHLPAGVTIRGDRRGTRLGPELRGGYGPGGMLEIAGHDVRITGLRLLGPSRSLDEATPEATGILAHDNYLRSIIDHNDMSDWSESAVHVEGEELSETCNPSDHRDPRARPRNVLVARNFLHHNQRWNSGYGVVVYDGAFPLIEGNTFVSNRHAIAADGRSHTGYSAQFNLVLAATPNYPDHGPQQDFDMHGRGSADDSHYVGGVAGEYVEVARNTFLGANRLNFYLRGTPCDLAEFNSNISVDSPGTVLENLAMPESKLMATGNQFNAPNPTNRFGVGDFDGDGKDDLLLATGAAWYYAPAGQTEWRFLNAQTDKMDTLLFGDFDGDGRTDVFTEHGRDWLVSWGGSSPWEKINESDAQMKDFAIGDFDGDHHADVFYASGQQWFVSSGGVGPFKLLDTSSFRIPHLRFGDFNGDGKTDIFSVVGDAWMVSYSGTSGWSFLRPKLTDSVEHLTVADLDGNGRADVAWDLPHLINSWSISRGGTSDWGKVNIAAPGLGNIAAIGHFNGNIGSDVLLWGWPDSNLYITSVDSNAAVRYSGQEMR